MRFIRSMFSRLVAGAMVVDNTAGGRSAPSSVELTVKVIPTLPPAVPLLDGDDFHQSAIDLDPDQYCVIVGLDVDGVPYMASRDDRGESASTYEQPASISATVTS